MDFIKKAFLFGVGVIAVAYEEVEKSIRKTIKTVEDEREKMQKQLKREQAH
jgi:hypothetical protein